MIPQRTMAPSILSLFTPGGAHGAAQKHGDAQQHMAPDSDVCVEIRTESKDGVGPKVCFGLRGSMSNSRLRV